jgi:hypothetical protein
MPTFAIHSLLTLLALVLIALLLGIAILSIAIALLLGITIAIRSSIHGLLTCFPSRVYCAVTHVALGLAIKGDSGSYGNAIRIFRYLNRTLAWCSTL